MMSLSPWDLMPLEFTVENYALKIGEHIKTVSQRTEKHFYEQLHMMGNMYDWDHKLETNKEDYYKWTQWLFVQLFKAVWLTGKRL